MPAELVVHQIKNAVSDGTFKKRRSLKLLSNSWIKKCCGYSYRTSRMRKNILLISTKYHAGKILCAAIILLEKHLEI